MKTGKLKLLSLALAGMIILGLGNASKTNAEPALAPTCKFKVCSPNSPCKGGNNGDLQFCYSDKTGYETCDAGPVNNPGQLVSYCRENGDMPAPGSNPDGIKLKNCKLTGAGKLCSKAIGKTCGEIALMKTR